MSDDGSRPDDRAFNRRERLEEECEERARERVDESIKIGWSTAALIALLEDLAGEDARDVDQRVERLLAAPNEATANSFVFAMRRCAFRRALIAERKSAGLDI